MGQWRPRAFIGVKRMGDLDGKPFHEASKIKFLDEEAEEKALELCSLWEVRLRDPSWHPFKVILDKEGNSKVCNAQFKQNGKIFNNINKSSRCVRIGPA